ncbi:Protein NLRC5 [Holothuria leucospilota]|uniref:Protein NLRC5 n=1 Tax=Holothuria leucospilota TaxID=206669 RepID=A0A9Q0YLW0_HOLLE|nr:Protein NLRC5 [Holothuria leucospilota]
MATFISNCSKELAGDDFLQDLTDHIVDQWQAVGRHLNVPSGTITVLKANNAGDLREVIFQMLMSWKQEAGFGATYEVLALALQKARRKDLAELVCKGKLPDGSKGNTGNTLSQADILTNLKKDLKWFYPNSLCKIPMCPWGGEKVSIENIFTNVQLLQRMSNPQEPQREVPLDSIHKLFPSDHQKERTRSILQGKAGSGKSTTVARLAFEWASDETDPDSPLRSYDLLFVLKMRAMTPSQNLGDAIISQLLSADKGYTAEEVEKFIKDHDEKIAIIFDGFDEFPSPVKGSVVGNIMDILRGKRLRHCCILVTMRPWKVLESKDLADYTVYEVKGFSPENVVSFVMDKNFKQQPEMGRKLLKYLELSNLKESIASIPLLASLLCHLWKTDSSMMEEPPTRLGELFECLSSCFSPKSVTDDNPVCSSSDEERVDEVDDTSGLMKALGPVALDGILSDQPQLIFSLADLKTNLEKAVLKEAKGAGILTFEEKRRPSVKRRSAKGRKMKETFVSFYHKVIQEYCAGLQLASLRENDNSNFEVYISKIQSVARALDLSYVLSFASWKSQQAAEEIMNLLLKIFNEELKVKVPEYEKGSLPLHECQIMQKYFELCLQLNFEADSQGKLNQQLSSIFCNQVVRMVGISSYVAEALGHYLKYIGVEDDSHACTCDQPLKSLQLMQLNLQSTTAFREVRKQFPSAEEMHTRNMKIYTRQNSADLERLKCSLTIKEKTGLTGMEHWNDYEFIAKYQLCQLFKTWQYSRISLQPILTYLMHLRLEKLTLTGQHLSDSLCLLTDALRLGRLSRLMHLSLSHCELTENETEELAPFIQNLTSLRELDLTNNRLGPTFGEHLAKIVNLNTLMLEKTIYEVDVMEKFAESFQSLTYLTCLEFRRNEITEVGMLKLSSSLSFLQNLQAVHLPMQNLPAEVFPKLVEALAQHKDLRDVQLLHTCWPSELCQSVAHIVPKLKKLEDFRISVERMQTEYPEIIERDVTYLVEALCKLKHLKMFSILHVKMDISLLQKMVKSFTDCESSQFESLRISKKLVYPQESLHGLSDTQILLLW